MSMSRPGTVMLPMLVVHGMLLCTLFVQGVEGDQFVEGEESFVLVQKQSGLFRSCNVFDALASFKAGSWEEVVECVAANPQYHASGKTCVLFNMFVCIEAAECHLDDEGCTLLIDSEDAATRERCLTEEARRRHDDWNTPPVPQTVQPMEVDAGAESRTAPVQTMEVDAGAESRTAPVQPMEVDADTDSRTAPVHQVGIEASGDAMVIGDTCDSAQLWTPRMLQKCPYLADTNRRNLPDLQPGPKGWRCVDAEAASKDLHRLEDKATVYAVVVTAASLIDGVEVAWPQAKAQELLQRPHCARRLFTCLEHLGCYEGFDGHDGKTMLTSKLLIDGLSEHAHGGDEDALGAVARYVAPDATEREIHQLIESTMFETGDGELWYKNCNAKFSLSRNLAQGQTSYDATADKRAIAFSRADDLVQAKAKQLKLDKCAQSSKKAYEWERRYETVNVPLEAKLSFLADMLSCYFGDVRGRHYLLSGVFSWRVIATSAEYARHLRNAVINTVLDHLADGKNRIHFCLSGQQLTDVYGDAVAPFCQKIWVEKSPRTGATTLVHSTRVANFVSGFAARLSMCGALALSMDGSTKIVDKFFSVRGTLEQSDVLYGFRASVSSRV